MQPSNNSPRFPKHAGGRPPGASKPLRLYEDAMAIGVSALYNLDDAMSARLANRLVDVNAAAIVAQTEAGDLRLELSEPAARPGLATIKSLDRYTHQRLRGRAKLRPKEAAWLSLSTKMIVGVLGADTRFFAQAFAAELVRIGWEKAIVWRLLDFAVLNHARDANYTNLEYAAAQVRPGSNNPPTVKLNLE